MKTTAIAMPRRAQTTPAVSPPPGRNATAAATTRTINTLRSVLFTTLRRIPRALGRQRPQLRGEHLVVGPEPERRGRRAVGRLGHRRGGLALGDLAALDRLGREAVADAEVRVDVAPLRRRLLQLLAQL